uniref:Uncharacterized protein n=1 Tax=Anguilla anguilla TaxID=7936 RepID=A0A0E9SJM6_ANGAN
MPFTHVHRIK